MPYSRDFAEYPSQEARACSDGGTQWENDVSHWKRDVSYCGTKKDVRKKSSRFLSNNDSIIIQRDAMAQDNKSSLSLAVGHKTIAAL